MKEGDENYNEWGAVPHPDSKENMYQSFSDNIHRKMNFSQ